MSIANSYTALTAGALLFQEFEAINHLLVLSDGFKLLDKEVKSNELLKIKTEASRKRIIQEIKRRAVAVNLSFWADWAHFLDEEKRLALLYVVLKTYPIAQYLHFEVTIPKWLAKQYELEVFDLQMRLDEMASKGHVVEQWTEATKRKTLTTYINILREAGLLTNKSLRRPQNIEISFWRYMAQNASPWFFDACLLGRNEREKYL